MNYHKQNYEMKILELEGCNKKLLNEKENIIKHVIN